MLFCNNNLQEEKKKKKKFYKKKREYLTSGRVEISITFQFHSLGVSLSNMQERVFMSCIPDIWHLKG